MGSDHDVDPLQDDGATNSRGDATEALEAYVHARQLDDASAATSASAIYHDALAWLAEHHPACAPLTASRLGRFLQNELHIKTDKRSGRIVYRGIRICVTAASASKDAAQK